MVKKAEALFDIDSYKDTIIKDFIFSKNIVEAIDSQQENIFVADDLIHKNIFPYGYIPETITKADSFVTVCVNNFKANSANKSFANIEIKIRVIVHRTRQSVKGRPGPRVDYISKFIRELLDGSMKYGWGRLELFNTVEDALDTNHAYRELHFKTVDMTLTTQRKAGRV